MPLIFFGALFVPRIAIVLLWLLTDWFVGVFTVAWVPLVGSLFFPYSLLWYSVVVNLFGGVWSIVPVVVMAVAVIADIGSEVGHYWNNEPEYVS